MEGTRRSVRLNLAISFLQDRDNRHAVFIAMVARPLTDLSCTSFQLLIRYVRSCTMYTYTIYRAHWKSIRHIPLLIELFKASRSPMFLDHCSNPTRQASTMRDFTQYSHLRQSSDLTVDLDGCALKEQDTFLPGSRGSEETRESHCEEDDNPFPHRSSAALVAHAVLLVCNTVILGLSVLLWLRGGSNCPYGANGPGLIRSMSSSTPSLPPSLIPLT